LKHFYDQEEFSQEFEGVVDKELFAEKEKPSYSKLLLNVKGLF
jgi:hypothetical protein